MSGRYLILEFTGRNSGRTFRTPVAYLRHGDELLISTDSPWWRNLPAVPEVEVLLRRRARPANARLVDDAKAAVDALRELVQIPGYPRAAGLRTEGGTVSDAELHRAVDEGRRVFRIVGE